MVYKAHSVASSCVARGFAVFLLGLSLSAAAKPVKAPLTIVPNKQGVVLTGKFDAAAKKSFPPPYPRQASVRIAVGLQGPVGTVSPDLTFMQDSFRAQLQTADLPSIPAKRNVTFTLSFPSNDSLVFETTREFVGAIGPKSEGATGSSGTNSVPLQKSVRTDINQPLPAGIAGPPGPRGNDGSPGTTPAMPFLRFVPLGVVVEVDTTLLLILTALLVWQLMRVRSRQSRGSTEKHLPGGESVRVESTSRPLSSLAIETLREDLNRRLSHWETDWSAIQVTIADLKRGLETVNRLLADEARKAPSAAEQQILEQFNLIANTLQTVRRDERPSPQTGFSGSIGVDVAVASIVNEWLIKGSQDRQQLLSLALQAGLRDARLAEYKDAGTTASGGKPEYSFGFTSDGSWLWTKVQNSDDFWAAPADSIFLTMGDAPAMLNKLFDGMQDAGPRFRFKAIYKPCRLCPVPGSAGKFNLLERGVLHLEGASLPSQTNLVSFATIARSTQKVDGSASMGASLAEWIKNMGERLVRQDHQIRELLDELRTLPSPGITTEQAASLSLLRDEVDRIRLETKQNATRVDAVANEVQKLTSPVTTTVPRDLPNASELSSVANRSSVSLPPTELPVEQPVVAVMPKRFSKASQHAVLVAASPYAPASSTARLADTVRRQEVDVVDAREPDRPSPLWQKAFDQAAERPGAEPGNTGVSSGETYLNRVRVYCEELKRVDASAFFAIVHFQKAVPPNQHLIHLHETGPDHGDPGGTVCLTCGKPPAWQFAISAGHARENTLYLLFPKCMLDKSKYASVYSALFENLPEIPFSTAAMQGPAVLAYDKRHGFFSVVQKIKQTPSGLADKAPHE